MSMSEFIVLIESAPMSWSSMKQGFVALSTFEVEYDAMKDGSK